MFDSLWEENTLQQLEVAPIIQRCLLGDIWQLGKHRLMCGDSTKSQDVDRLFQGEHFTLCFTSPMYTDQREYKLGTFDWSNMMCCSFDQMIAHGTPNCNILINLGLSHKNRQVDLYWTEWLEHCENIGWPLYGWYVWDKGTALPGDWSGRLAPSHEFVFHFNFSNSSANKWVATKRFDSSRGFRQKNGTIKPPTSPDKFGQAYKVPDSIIRINRENTRGIYTEYHPAVFPVALPEFAMKTWSQPGDIVYEPFCGSGTSIIAGERIRRRVYAMEIEPSYCDLAIQRWEQVTGQKAKRYS